MRPRPATDRAMEARPAATVNLTPMKRMKSGERSDHDQRAAIGKMRSPPAAANSKVELEELRLDEQRAEEPKVRGFRRARRSRTDDSRRG